MRRRIASLALFAIVVLGFGSFVSGQTVYQVYLTGLEAGTVSNATGKCLATLNAAETELSVICSHDVANVTSAHIHYGLPGESGVPLYTFSNLVSPFHGKWALTAQNHADLQNGALYIQVHSPAFPGGEIRGQFGPAADRSVAFSMNGAEVVPPTASAASGSCAGVLTPEATNFWIGCTNNVPGMTGVRLSRGLPGEGGPTFYLFGASTAVMAELNPASFMGSDDYGDFLRWLNGGELYVSVGSATYPNGAIRGQVPSPPSVTYFPQFGTGDGFQSTIVLTNTSTTAAVSGVARFQNPLGAPLFTGLTDTAKFESPEDGVVPMAGEPVSGVAFTIPPLGKVTIETDGEGTLSEGIGSAKVITGFPLVGVLKFTVPGIGIAGERAAAAQTSVVVPARKKGTLKTAVAIRNSEPYPVFVRCDLLDEDGQLMGSNSVIKKLPANGRISLFLSELFNVNLPDFEGVLRISSQVGSFSAVALEMGNQPGLFTILSVGATTKDQ